MLMQQFTRQVKQVKKVKKVLFSVFGSVSDIFQCISREAGASIAQLPGATATPPGGSLWGTHARKEPCSRVDSRDMVCSDFSFMDIDLRLCCMSFQE